MADIFEHARTAGTIKLSRQDRIMIAEIATEIARVRGFIAKVSGQEATVLAIRLAWQTWVVQEKEINEAGLRANLPGV